MKNYLISLVAMCLMYCHGVTSLAQTARPGYTISQPYVFKNLTVWFVLGEDQTTSLDFFSLKEAIDKDFVKVYETSNVGELAVENFGDKPVFIQSGDIVKGGKQDRVIKYDIIISPKSEKIPLASFCVEHGRWSKRGEEEQGEFNSSSKRISSKRLKLAAVADESQQDVWDEVENLQDKLNENLDADVQSTESYSSLQLTLENELLEKKSAEFVEFFNQKIELHNNAVGMVFAINGEVNSADLYYKAELFQKRWPQLIDAAAVEAISETDNRESLVLDSDFVLQWTIQAKGELNNTVFSSEAFIKFFEIDRKFSFETYLLDNADFWIHRNVINN